MIAAMPDALIGRDTPTQVLSEHLREAQDAIQYRVRSGLAASSPGDDMPSKYAALYTYLENRYANVVVLTFAQIEDLIGFSLPELARTQREWWAATDAATDESQPSASAWASTGRTVTPNLLARTVLFERS